MTLEHTVKSYDEELNRLQHGIAEMGSLAELELQNAVQALVRRKAELGHQIVQDDVHVDELEQQATAQVVRLLALRQPMASDLREIVAALKIASDLERIGDYAANIGKRVVALSQTPPFKLPAALPRMGWLAQQNMRDTLAAYAERNPEKALRAWQADEELDETYSSLFRELLTHMMEDPRNIGSCTHLMFIAKNIERIGDHATNIAETVYFMVLGEPIGSARPKGDSSSYMPPPQPKL
ncbi:MAG TPA: phosphate signaling complex protein PhoU [Dongiaceae bacterium]|nr:phosphate signaling complex protein PhoU [Dongiaceae bacterium]